MSHNPNTVKSQDDLSTTNDGKRSSDVVLSAVEKCERLQKQLDIAKTYLEHYRSIGRGWVVLFAIEGLSKIEELNK